jgi:hypothetical protein
VSALWIRRPPERREGAAALLAAGIAAAGVGVLTFYLTRILLARDSLGDGGVPAPLEQGPGGASDATATGVGGA